MPLAHLFGFVMVSALQTARVLPDAEFSVNDWTAIMAFTVFTAAIGLIGGPVAGTLVCFLPREFPANPGTINLLFLRSLAILVMLAVFKGIGGYATARWGISRFPAAYAVQEGAK